MSRQDIDIKFGANLDGLRTGMQQVNSSLKGFQKSVMNISGMMGAAFGAQEIMQFGKEAIDLAVRAEGVVNAFEKLGQPGLLKELQTATKGTVDNLTLMQTAVKANNFGLPLEQLGTYLKFAQERARATGEDVNYLVESIVLGISRKSLPILDNLGFSAERVRTAMAETGDMASAVGQIISEEFDKAGESSLTVADRIDQQKVAIENLKLSIGQSLLPVYEGWLNWLSGAMRIVNNLLGEHLGLWEKIAYAAAVMTNNQAMIGMLDAMAGVRQRMSEGVSVSGPTLGGGLATGGVATGGGGGGAIARMNEGLVTLATKTLPQATAAFDTMAQANISTMAMFDETVLKMNETWERMSEVSSMFGQALQQSFEAALINGEDFFKVLGQWIENFIKQLLASVAAALALTAILGLATGGFGSLGFMGQFGKMLGGMGGGGGQIFGVLSGSDIFLSNQRTGNSRTRTGG